MPAPAPHKSQRIRVKGTNTFFHVRVSNATDCNSRHLPTPDELLTRTVDKPAGYTYVDLNCVTGSGTATVYARVVVMGNSITLHGGTGPNPGDFIVNAANPKRGMAATAPDKDFVRLLTAKHRVNSPNVDFRTLADFGVGEETLSAGTGPYMEGLITGTSTAYYNEVNGTRFAAVAGFSPELIYMRLGENVNDAGIATIGQAEFIARYKALIDKLISGGTTAKVVLSTSVWDRPNFDQAMRAISAERNYPIADFGGMWQARMTNGFYALNPNIYTSPAVSEHPDDEGMAKIANDLFAKTPGVTGGAAVPTPIDATFVSYADQGWVGADLKFIENSEIKIGFKRTVGAVICYAEYKTASPGENLINDYQVSDARAGDPRAGTTFSDKGRQLQFGSDYWTPGGNWTTPGGANTSLYGFDTGGNTVQGGSLANYYAESQVITSAVFSHPTRGTMFYAKIKPKLWAVPNEDGPVFLEQWVWLVGTAVQYHIRHTISHVNHNQQTYQSRGQENPCAYIIAPMSNYRLVTGAPGSASVSPRAKGQLGLSRPFFTSEGWVGGYKDGGGQGVTLYSPTNSVYNVGQFVDIFGNGFSNASAYLNNCQFRNYDNNGVYEDGGYIILGTESQARAKIATLPGPDQSYDFDFALTNEFANNDCRVIREVNNDLTWHIGDSKTDNGQTNFLGNMMSPARAWQAGNLTTISFEMAVTGISTLGLKWRKPGESDAAGTEFRKTFPVTGDGVMRTYTVSTSDANWSGIICSAGIEVPFGLIPAAGAKVIVKRFKKL